MRLSGVKRFWAALALVCGCARAHEREPDAGSMTPPPDAGATADAVTVTADATGADASCWSCGLPSGMVSLTFDLVEADCEFDFANGSVTSGSADIVVDVTGTAPNGLQAAIYTASGLPVTCTVPVDGTGAWDCSQNTGVSMTSAHGQIAGLTMTASEVHDETDYFMSCPRLIGNGR
jgi:hypothetical protein